MLLARGELLSNTDGATVPDQYGVAAVIRGCCTPTWPAGGD
jgi:hypothetical protein